MATKSNFKVKQGLDVQEQITSYYTSGAPFILSSSTVVINLNADLLDGNHGSYYAPISNPTFTGAVNVNVAATPSSTVINEISDFTAIGLQIIGDYANNGDKKPIVWGSGSGNANIGCALLGGRGASGWNTEIDIYCNGVTAGSEGTDAIQKVATFSNSGLEVAQTVTATAFTETSSIAFKENINPIENALDSILKLTGVTYDRIDGSILNESGFIAEEVEKVLPSVVTKINNQPYGIMYTKIKE